MPEQQETTKFYLVSSLLIDITSRVLSRTLNTVCSRLNTAFEPLLNLNIHNFFHLWKTDPCCQCSEAPEVNSVVYFRDSDWIRLYQQHQRRCGSGACSCCYRALPGIQPNSIDFSLSTKILVSLKALRNEEYECILEIQKYEPELKQAQEDRLVPYRKSSKLPDHWEDVLATLEKLASEHGNGYWENLKEVKKLKEILSGKTDDDGFQIRYKEDNCPEQPTLTEDLIPKQTKPLTDSAYFEQSEYSEEKSEQVYEKATLHADDADSGYPDNLSFKSPRDPLDDDIHGRTGYIEDAISEERYPTDQESTLKIRTIISFDIIPLMEYGDPLFWEKQHGLLLQRMRGECQAVARRCSNLSQDMTNLRQWKDLPTPTQRTASKLSTVGRQTGKHSQNVDSSYPGHHKVPLTNKEFNKLMDASFDCLVNSRAVLQNSSPLDAGRDFIYSSSAREYVRWLDARNADDTAYDLIQDEDKVDSRSYYEGYQNVGVHENRKAAMFDTDSEGREESEIYPRKADYTEHHFPLDETNEKPGEIFMKWVEDSSRFSQLAGHDVEKSDGYWTSNQSYTSSTDDFRPSKSNSFEGSDFYRRSMERCQTIKQRSDAIRFDLQRSQNKLRAMSKRDSSIVQDLESVSSDDETYDNNMEYPLIATSEVYEHGTETKPSRKYDNFMTSPAASPIGLTRRFDHVKRHSTPIHMVQGTSYLDKYDAWLSESVKKVKEDPKYGNHRAGKWEKRPERVTMASPVYEDIPEVISEDEYRLLPSLSSASKGIGCFRLSHSCPQLPESDTGRLVRRNWTSDEKDWSSDRSVQEFKEYELAELTEEKRYGNFISRSKESLCALREKSLQTRMEIERVRSQFLTGTV